MTPDSDVPTGFSEKDFYLAEFRGRTLAFALSQPDSGVLAPLGAVLETLGANHTRSVVFASDRVLLEKIVHDAIVELGEPRWIGTLWRKLRLRGCAGLMVSQPAALADSAAAAALALGVAKLMWIDPDGGLVQSGGERLSCVDLRGLDRLLEAGAAALPEFREAESLLRQIRRLLSRGFPSVAICSAAEIADELFCYEGSGTLFTRDLYTNVRRLALDDFDAALDLIRRGVHEGYLVERSEEELDEIIANAFGVFVESRFLAGVGALLPHQEDRAGEIASLYTLTRFIGEGVGGLLVLFAVEEARRLGCTYVFACTATDRVVRFFERHGFRQVPHGQVPSEKWKHYDSGRRDRVRCLRFDLEA